MWVTSQTRPDASFDNCKVSSYGKNPKVKNLIEASKAVKKLQSSTLRLVYPDLGSPEYLKVIVYGDAIHASLPSGPRLKVPRQGFSVVIIGLFQSRGNRRN